MTDKTAAAKSKPIEEGWSSYREMVIPKDAPEVQINECRQAFFAGAVILMAKIMRSLDPGDEPSDADMQRMADIQDELDAFGQQIDKRYLVRWERLG